MLRSHTILFLKAIWKTFYIIQRFTLFRYRMLQGCNVIKLFQIYTFPCHVNYLYNRFSVCCSVCNELRSESRCHLAQPKKKSYYSNLTLQSLSTPIWNNIQPHMRSALTVNTFKSMLKTASFLYIFNRYIYNYHTQSNCAPILHVYY